MPDGGWILKDDAAAEGAEPTAAADPILNSADPLTATAVVLQLRWLWACHAVGAGLHRMCPNLEDLDILSNSAALQDAVRRFAPLVLALRGDLQGITELDEVARIGATHYADGIEALTELATALAVPPDTLMTVLMHA